MLNKKIYQYVKRVDRFTFINVFLKVILLLENVIFLMYISHILANLLRGDYDISISRLILALITYILIRVILSYFIGKVSYIASKDIKTDLRRVIFKKLCQNYNLALDNKQNNKLLQLCVEGVSQLEQYFANYLPQLYYAIIAPLLLMIIFMKINFYYGVTLFIFVWLMPLTIGISQIIAKKVVAKHWGDYLNLGSTFSENLQGLMTLKIFNADGRFQKKMDQEAQNFRRQTMRVLVMQLNSITIMDLITYLGSAMGIMISIYMFYNGEITTFAFLLSLFLSFEFFLPMRILGSYFLIAMHGMAASERLIEIMQTPSSGDDFDEKIETITFADCQVVAQDKIIRENISVEFKDNITAIVGASGIGKSTLIKTLLKQYDYAGEIKINSTPLSEINTASIYNRIGYFNNKNYLFNIPLRENILLANPNLSDQQIWDLLKLVKLDSYFSKLNGLDTVIDEGGSNLSIGQRQRLNLIQALVSEKDFIIFDEITSSVDQESEQIIIDLISKIRDKKVILITHRLENTKIANKIIYFKNNETITATSFDQMLMDDEFKENYYQQRYYENYKGEKNGI